ncbi:MAG: hypothetical protein PVG22_15350, partial [Chromatiales bacterium]
MGELEKILTDIFLVKPPERLAKTMGAEGNDPIDAIMRKLYSEGISDAQSLAQWIKKYLGKLTIIEILDELDLEYDAETEPSELIAAWFGHRRIGEYAPAARPFELAKRLLEQARQAETTGNLDVRKLLTPDLESLFRCTAFFYSREILKHESCCKGQVMPEVGLEVVKPVAILSDASLGGLCNFLDCQKQLSAEPYNSGCPDKLLLADSRTRELLGKIRTMTELSAEEMITQDMAAYPGLVRELMQKWGAGESDSTIPKGCRVASSRVSGFASEVLCVDELNERIRLNGIKTETRITVGDDVLLRTSDTASVWASGLEPLPKGEKWVTSGNGPHRPPESDHGLLPASRTQVFISYSHLDK